MIHQWWFTAEHAEGAESGSHRAGPSRADREGRNGREGRQGHPRSASSPKRLEFLYTASGRVGVRSIPRVFPIPLGLVVVQALVARAVLRGLGVLRSLAVLLLGSSACKPCLRPPRALRSIALCPASNAYCRTASPLSACDSICRTTMSWYTPRAAISSVVRAALDDAPVLHQQDQVRAAHRRQPVRDHERRAARRAASPSTPGSAARSPCRGCSSPRRGSGSAAAPGSRARSRGAAAGRPRASRRARRRTCRSRSGSRAMNSCALARRAASSTSASVASWRP